MTRVRWTTDAASDLVQIVERIREDNPEAAQRVAKTIYDGIAALRTFPNRGRIGLVPHTRELVFAPWPYIAVYEIAERQVRVLHIRHASQLWPQSIETTARRPHWGFSSHRRGRMKLPHHGLQRNPR